MPIGPHPTPYHPNIYSLMRSRWLNSKRKSQRPPLLALGSVPYFPCVVFVSRLSYLFPDCRIYCPIARVKMISREEFRKGCEVLNTHLGTSDALKDVDHMLDLMDFDGSGAIDVNEFFEVMLWLRWHSFCLPLTCRDIHYSPASRLVSSLIVAGWCALSPCPLSTYLCLLIFIADVTSLYHSAFTCHRPSVSSMQRTCSKSSESSDVASLTAQSLRWVICQVMEVYVYVGVCVGEWVVEHILNTNAIIVTFLHKAFETFLFFQSVCFLGLFLGADLILGRCLFLWQDVSCSGF